MKKIVFLIAVEIFCSYPDSIGQVSSLVSVGPNGHLIYSPDAKGNVIPDFSGVGFKNGEASIPFVPVVLSVNPVAGDNTSNVQNAINTVALMPLQSNGFRGAILFNAGTYGMDSSVLINTSGIVLRGVGSATIFKATGAYQYNLVNIIGSAGKTELYATVKKIQNPYVPYGAKSVTVGSGHTFQTGDWVNVRRQPNSTWIQTLGMDTLTNIDPGSTNWVASAYDISYERQIVNVSGNTLTFDCPLMDIIDTVYSKGYVLKFSDARIENCAIEHINMASSYASSTDENHGWNAIFINNIKNAWVKSVEATSFGYSCVNIADGASFVTVDSCNMFDPISMITGGRRYCFNIDGQRSLVEHCATRRGRHDYVNGSRTPGPNVFYKCTSTLEYNDMGPHHRWSTGILFDNITGDGQLRVQNRLASGSGHGWSGGQIMFWNCDVPDIVVQDPPTDETNWGIGCIGNVSNVGEFTTTPIGIVQSVGTHIAAIPSLFLAQLNDRLSILPMKLLSFNAVKGLQKVVIQWATASEINARKFDVERSIDGIRFESIASINAKGIANGTTNYSIEDQHPSNGSNYYRLKLVDNDAKFSYSSIVNVSFDKAENSGLTITPNPVNNWLSLALVSSGNLLSGRMINCKGNQIVLLKGSLAAIGQQVNNCLGNLAAGVYFIEIFDSGKRYVQQFFKK